MPDIVLHKFVLKRSVKMMTSLNNISEIQELTADDLEPFVGNVKYAQRSEEEVLPVVANVKYAQLNEEEVLPVVANVKYAQRNDEEKMTVAEVA
jgi:hypothetical protein